MLKTVMMIGMLVPSILHAQEFWSGVKWGMTRDEINSVLPGVRDYTTRAGGKTFHWFGLPHYDIQGCDAFVEFNMKDGHVDELTIDVPISIGSASQRVAYRCGIILQDGLTSKYGSAVSDHLSKGTVNSKYSIWNAPHAQISCGTMSLAAYGGQPESVFSLSVIYRPRDWGAAGKL